MRAWRPILCGLLTAAALPAVAQDVSAGDYAAGDLNVSGFNQEAEPQPDWYRRFTLSQIETPSLILREGEVRDYHLEWQPRNGVTLDFNFRRRGEDLAIDQGLKSPLAREEVTAGAEFQITRRFSLGGQISLGGDTLKQARKNIDDPNVDAGIRLRSAFKF